MTALTEPTVKVRVHKQSAAEARAVYDYVTARDVTCRAPAIVAWNIRQEADTPADLIVVRFECSDKLERHHAGNTIGSKRITDARHVVLLCAFHHRTWAPTHSRLILAWLADIEDAREAAR